MGGADRHRPGPERLDLGSRPAAAARARARRAGARRRSIVGSARAAAGAREREGEEGRQRGEAARGLRDEGLHTASSRYGEAKKKEKDGAGAGETKVAGGRGESAVRESESQK